MVPKPHATRVKGDFTLDLKGVDMFLILWDSQKVAGYSWEGCEVTFKGQTASQEACLLLFWGVFFLWSWVLLWLSWTWLCRPGWSWSHRDPPASTSYELGSKVYSITIPCWSFAILTFWFEIALYQELCSSVDKLHSDCVSCTKIWPSPGETSTNW